MAARMGTQQSRLSIICFLALTVLVSAIFTFLIIDAGRAGVSGGNYMIGLMWAPGLAAVLTVRLLRLDPQSLGLRWGGARYALIGYAMPLAYGAIAYGLTWMLGFGTFAQPAQIEAITRRLGWEISHPAVVIPLFFVLLGTTQIIVNVARALGEEIGWRGFLAPLLVERLGFTAGAIAGGVIWAAWHFPLYFFAGYNAGTPWWFALPCFCAMVIGLSVILTWLRQASNSVWPCAILHASHNLFIQAVFTPLTGAKGSVTDYVSGEFGVAVAAVVLVFAFGCWRLAQPVRGDARQNGVANGSSA
jgi:membrane protease YdiL (CAAX protease family)